MPNTYYSTGERSHMLQRVMRALHVPGSTYTKTDLADRAATTARTLDHAIRLLRSCGLIHIAAWSHAGGWSGLKAHYGFGPGPDAPHTTPEPATGWRYSRVHADIMATLTGEMTAQDVATAVNANPIYVAKLLRKMSADGPDQSVHITRWLRNYEVGGAFSRLYALGAGRNATRPNALGNKKCNQRYRSRLARDFGRAMATRMLKSSAKGGIDQLVLDGKTVWERRKPRGKKSNVAVGMSSISCTTGGA